MNLTSLSLTATTPHNKLPATQVTKLIGKVSAFALFNEELFMNPTLQEIELLHTESTIDYDAFNELIPKLSGYGFEISFMCQGLVKFSKKPARPLVGMEFAMQSRGAKV